jgi:transcriptional regulator with XRE-family HTH domain
VEFNEKLKVLRKMHGFSQEDFANLLGVGRSSYAQYETGDHLPRNLKLLKKMADLLGVRLSFLLDHTTGLDIPEESRENIEFAALVRGYQAKGLTKEQIKAILDAAVEMRKLDENSRKT